MVPVTGGRAYFSITSGTGGQAAPPNFFAFSALIANFLHLRFGGRLRWGPLALGGGVRPLHRFHLVAFISALNLFNSRVQ